MKTHVFIIYLLAFSACKQAITSVAPPPRNSVKFIFDCDTHHHASKRLLEPHYSGKPNPTRCLYILMGPYVVVVVVVVVVVYYVTLFSAVYFCASHAAKLFSKV